MTMDAIATTELLDSDLQLMRDAQALLGATTADDEALAPLIVRYLSHGSPLLSQIRLELASRLGARLDVLQAQAARRREWPASWNAEGFNRCITVAAEALEFLADNSRPIGGEDQFNALHLHQLAKELNVTLAACFPRPPGALSEWPVLTEPARIGSTFFNAGVSARLVVECAQRSAVVAKLEAGMSPAARREQEVARRALWDRLNGRLDVTAEPDQLSIVATRLGLPRVENEAAGRPKYKIFGADLGSFLADMGVELEQERVVDLQSLRQQLLEPAEPMVRDEQGFWSNPSFPMLDEDVNAELFLAAFGLEGCWVAAEDQLDAVTYDQILDSGCWAAWTPRPREGDGWVLLSIHDTEIGAVAGFVRAANTAAPGRAKR